MDQDANALVVRRAEEHLRREPGRVHATLFAILDAARAEAVPGKLTELEAESVSLYKDEPEEVLAAVAPYLVQLDPASPEDELFAWATGEGWGDSWGVFLTSTESLDDVREHFRRFLLVRDEDGKQLYFRFYDPRVLGVYLPTYTTDELETFFGPIASFVVEAQGGRELQRHYLRDGRLVRESFALTEAGDTPRVEVLEPAAPPPGSPRPRANRGRELRKRR